MNEQVLIKALQNMARENAELILSKSLLQAELEVVKAELAQLKEPQPSQPQDM